MKMYFMKKYQQHLNGEMSTLAAIDFSCAPITPFKRQALFATLALGLIGNPYFAHAACAPAPTSSTVVNVTSFPYGATPNDATDDTASIQAAIDAVPIGGTVRIPDGTYMIDALTHLNLKSNMTLRMTAGAILKAIPNSSGSYSIIEIDNAHNVNVVGSTNRTRMSTVQGERDRHTGTSGMWGMGVFMMGSDHVVIEGITSINNWGDAFYIGGYNYSRGYIHNTNIQLCSVVANNNRRQGLSITWADGVVVRNSTFKNTSGVSPQSGIDIEPILPFSVNNVPFTPIANNVQILNSQILSNKGTGIAIWSPGTTNIKNVTINGNTITDNKNASGGGLVIKTQAPQRVTNNIIKNNIYSGIRVIQSDGSMTGNTIIPGIIGNTITNNQKYGILLDIGAINNNVANNRVTGQTVSNILDLDGSNIIDGSNITN